MSYGSKWFLIFFVILIGCGSGEKKTKVTISDFEFCLEADSDGFCKESSTEFPLNTAQIFAVAKFAMDKRGDGAFQVEWALLNNTFRRVLGSYSVTPKSDGTGHVHSDLKESLGLGAGTYQVKISYSSASAEGEGSANFLVKD